MFYNQFSTNGVPVGTSPCDCFTNHDIFQAKIFRSDEMESQQSLFHDQFISQTLNQLAKKFNHIKTNMETENNSKKKIITAIQNSLFYIAKEKTLEVQISKFYQNLKLHKRDINNITSKYMTKIEGNIRKLPIKPIDFPHYISIQSNTNNNEEDKFKNDEKTLISILDQSEDKDFKFSQDDLFRFYDIISQYDKPFSFSPFLVEKSIRKLEIFLNTLRMSSNQEIESEDFTCYQITLLILMHISMLIHRLHDFMVILLEFIIIEQNKKNFKDDHFSFKNIVDKTLPKCSTSRTKILGNVSGDQILDFSLSYNAEKDYILTKDGIFKIEDDMTNHFSKLKPIEINQDKNTTIYEDLKQSNKDDAKISFSNGILYLFLSRENIIHRIYISEDEETIKKALQKQKKQYRSKEKPEKKENKSKKKLKYDKITHKKLKEKEKKEKRLKRKKERYEYEHHDINLKSIKIDLPDYPVISFGSYNNFIRIIQRKSYDDNKTTLIFTNIDLIPNCRTNFDIDEAFSYPKQDNAFKQTQIEIEIGAKNQKFKMIDAFFANDFMFVSFEDSSIEKFIIYNDGRMEKESLIECPFHIFPHSRLKVDDKMFLYKIDSIQKEDEFGVSISKMFLPETKIWLSDENGLFLKYPYLFNLSNIVNSCSQFILNRDVTKLKNDHPQKCKHNQKKQQKPKEENNLFKLKVSPDEMSCLVQGLNTIYTKHERIIELIKKIKDDDLKQFFISLFIKLSGINLLYGINQALHDITKDSKMKEIFQSFKSFILDLNSLSQNSYSNTFDIMIRESMIFTMSLSGKYLFFPDSYEQLRDIMNQIFVSPHSQRMLKGFSSFMFSYPSSLYIIDDRIYEKLMQIKDEIDLFGLFNENIIFILLENKFASDLLKNNEFVQVIVPYVESLFKYIGYALSQDNIPVIIVEQLLSYIIGFSIKNPFLSLILEKEMIGVAGLLYKRISQIPGVIENDNKFLENFMDLQKIEIKKEVKTIESQHPYNLTPLPAASKCSTTKDKDISTKSTIKRGKRGRNKLKKEKKFIIEDLGIIDFGSNVSEVYVQFDNRTKLNDNDEILIYSKSDNKVKKFTTANDFLFNRLFHVTSNKARIAIRRKIQSPEEQQNEEKYWGCKLTFTGIINRDQFKWSPNNHLEFYIYFVICIVLNHFVAYNSTQVEEFENEFDKIFNEKIIQGIKIEEIEKYEKATMNHENDQERIDKTPKRCISRGISRGIKNEGENDSSYINQFKKNFLTDLITTHENDSSPAKRFLDALYVKTAKQNRIKLNQSSKVILENEHYLAACLFKHLNLLDECINFIRILNVTKSDQYTNLNVPNCFVSLWKTIYSLRKHLFFEYQKSKTSDSLKLDFEKYCLEIKNKCKLLLYSDPIIKNNNNEKIESVSKSIYSFVTSKIQLSNISDLIDVRRKRLDVSKQSITLMLSFINQNLLFESTKPIFSYFYENQMHHCYNYRSYDLKPKPKVQFKGLSKRELKEYKKLFGLLAQSIIQNVFTQLSVPIISNTCFLGDLLFKYKNNDTDLDVSKTIIEVIENNKNNQSFFNDRISFLSVLILIGIAFKSQNKGLFDYIISLLFNDEIVLESKQLILIATPIFEHHISVDIAFSILEKKAESPVIIKYVFSLISSIFIKNESNLIDRKSFILKVFQGIGQSFIGKSCLFIDDSFQPFAHRQVAESMIAFIRLLFNSKNETLLKIIHEILTKSFKNIVFDDTNQNLLHDYFLLIGLFASLGQTLSAIEPDRKLSQDYDIKKDWIIKGFNPSNRRVKTSENICENVYGFYSNVVSITNDQIDLNEIEVENILQLHDKIMKSKYFVHKQNYFDDISQKETTDNILISSFYSFLPMVMQNKNNAKLLFNDKNMKQTLSLFELSKQLIPSNENSIIMLSHYLEQAIFSPLYNTKESNELNFENSFRFLKMNYGQIIYGNKDVIQTDKNYPNLFLCNRLFDSKCETFYEVKIRKIGFNNIFIGFINSEDFDYNNAFGFGCAGYTNVFCRKSPILASKLRRVGDEIMKNENNFLIKENDVIGCYYTSDYVYLTINGNLTQYRNSHKSLKTYIPIIFVDNDELELEIVRNVTIVDHSNNEFDFLNVNNYQDEFFKEKDINSIKIECEKESYLIIQSIDEADLFIGQNVYLDCYYTKYDKIHYHQALLPYRDNMAVIKDITPLEDSKFVSKLKVESYNSKTLSKEMVDADIDSKYVRSDDVNFFNLIENRTNTKFGFNSSYSLDYLPDKLKTISNMNELKIYNKNKTIKDNAKSIAILMTRYLVFILVDYLRYDKSHLLQDKGIDTIEAKSIIQALACSLPTITIFHPKFDDPLNNEILTKYIIFPDEQDNNEKNKYKIPGFSLHFHLAFKSFLKKSESFMSPHFLPRLIKSLYESSKEKETLTSIYSIYDSIPSSNKIESISPLPERLSIQQKIFDPNQKAIYDSFSYYYYQDLQNKLKNNIVGSIPILVDSIPDEFPCVKFNCMQLRASSDQVSYFTFNSISFMYNDCILGWDYDIEKIKQKKNDDLNKSRDYLNYKLRFGIFMLSTDLQENLLIGNLGFIQVVFIILQSFSDSKFLYEKHKDILNQDILRKISSISLKKSPLYYPFLKPIIVSLASKIGISRSLLDNQVIESLMQLSKTSKSLVKMNELPNFINETPLIIDLYSKLVKAIESKNDSISSLFEKYYSINEEMFKLIEACENDHEYIEGHIEKHKERHFYYDDLMEFNNERKRKRKKNFRSFYLLYYYSLLLNNEANSIYPKFLFVHDLIRQYFGGFRTIITHDDLCDFHEEKEWKIIYKSEVICNEFNLECSCKLMNIYEPKNKESCSSFYYNSNFIHSIDFYIEEIIEKEYHIIIHQMKDDKRIEIPKNGERIEVSFPLEILVLNEGDKWMPFGNIFIIDFMPSKAQQFDYFVNHYDGFEDEFKKFISYSKYDDQLSTSALNEESNLFNDCKSYEIKKIQDKLQLNIDIPAKNERTLSLRSYIISSFNTLVEEVITNNSINSSTMNTSVYEQLALCIPLPPTWNNGSIYMHDILLPAYAMSTESKFLFINKILSCKQGHDFMNIGYSIDERHNFFVFNRFEQQKFFESIEKNEFENKYSPLIVQFMNQIECQFLPQLMSFGKMPFHVKLSGENAIDAGGPAREIFSSLITEMMNDRIGIFTFNPNRNHCIKDTNQEDLIPNKYLIRCSLIDKYMNDSLFMHLYSHRFIYAGALIAICIVSKLPQPMKLPSFVWEYLSYEKVSIESIYEVDHYFEELIKNAENIQNEINLNNPIDFESLFLHYFVIKDSFDKVVELVSSGSQKRVTKDNLNEFIELAKNYRMHEFDNELYELKKGFDMIMCHKDIINILHPHELKLLACGESNCSVEQMKKLTIVNAKQEEMKEMFWKVIESFTVEERMLFIKFSSGNLGLPAPGLRWEKDLIVNILNKESGRRLALAHTCFSSVDIPFFESEEELSKILKMSINFSGLITDSYENPEEVSDFL